MQHGELASGSQINSSYHSIRSPSFRGNPQARVAYELPRFQTPGPGSYRTPSDFGYVDNVPR
jgi:hypothetical protein